MTEAHEGASVARWDIVEGFRSWRLWAYMGLVDIRQRYRRSMVGPIWLVLGLGVTVLGIGLLYSTILHTDPHFYIPFISISLLIWNFISTCLGESTGVLPSYSSIILSGRVPYSSFILRIIVRNLIVAAHCIVVVVIAFAFYGKAVSILALGAVPGVLLLVANLYWMMLAIAMVSARYRDVAQIVNYLIQIIFFLTPVIWQPSQIGPRATLKQINPFYHLLEAIRAPVFDGHIPLASLIYSSVMLVIGLTVTLLLFVRFRRNVVHWI